MNYEEKYKQALERARKVYIPIENNILDDIFPELAESEDERIRKKLICFVENWKKFKPNSPFDDYAVYTSDSGECDKILAWLEKQGEQPADKIEPKFKVKYADSEYNVLEIKESAGVTFYGIEDEPNHIDYIKADNCEIINGGYGVKEDGFSIPTKPAIFSEKKELKNIEPQKLYADSVIAWLVANICDYEYYIKRFKQDFGI